MPREKRPLTTSPRQQDDYAAPFIERFGEAAWAQERARYAEEAALSAGCKVQAFLDDPLTERYGAYDLASMVRCDCAGCTRDRQQPHPF